MAKEVLECVSIVFEIAAFFLVTVDLYGEARLMTLQSKIYSFKLDASDAINYVFFKVMMPFNGGISSLLSIGVYIISPFYFNKYWNKYIGISIWWDKHHLLKVFVVIIAGILIGAIFLFLLNLVFFLLVGFVIETIRWMVALLKSKPLKGWMLPFGAFLFLISKGIALYLAW